MTVASVSIFPVGHREVLMRRKNDVLGATGVVRRQRDRQATRPSTVISTPLDSIDSLVMRDLLPQIPISTAIAAGGQLLASSCYS